MPQIKEYTQRTDVTHNNAPIRGASGEDFGATIGRALQGAGEQVSEAGYRLKKANEQAEISDLNAKMSEAHAKFTVDFHQQLQTADPNDKEFAQKFVKSFDEYVGKIGDEVSTTAGRNYFKTASAAMRAHFAETASAGQSDLAGVKAKTDYTTALNNFSSSLVTDPSSFELMKNMHDASLSSLVATGGLPEKAALQLREHGQTEMAKSAVRGWIKLDPAIAKKQLDDGKWNTYINGDAKHQMYMEVKTAENAQRVEEERRKAEERRAREEKQVQIQNDFLQKMAEGKLTTRDVLDSQLDPFGSGSKNQFINMIESNDTRGTKIKTDSGTFIDLFDRIHLPDGDPKKIVNENDLNSYLGRGLTIESLNQLRQEIQGKKTQDGNIEAELKKGVTDIAKGMLTRSNPLTGIKDPVGDEQYQRFMTSFLRDYAEKRRNGKTPDELLNPDSPDYLGKNIRKFTRSQQQILQDMTKSISNVPAQQPAAEIDPKKIRLPNESAADYLKRQKEQSQ